MTKSPECLVLFDIDGTLTRGASLERQFFWWLLRQRQIGRHQFAAYLRFLFSGWRTYGFGVFRKNKAWLRGLSVHKLELLARSFIKAKIPTVLRADSLDRLRQHQASADTVVLLSGTLQPVAEALALELDVSHVIATLPGEDNDRYGSGPPSRHPYGDAKAQLARAWRNANPDRVYRVSAYGDSIHDRALLEYVDVPVCVHPDRRLRKLALARCYEIID